MQRIASDDRISIVTAGTYGRADGVQLPVVTTSERGRITAISNAQNPFDPSRFLGMTQASVPGATTLTSVGGFANHTQSSLSTFLEDATGKYNVYTTSTSAGVTGGYDFSVATPEAQFQLLPDFTFACKTGASANDITGIRIWVGIFSADPTASDNPAGHYIGFRFSSGAGDANWQAITKDNVTQAIANTGIVVATDTRYVLRLIATSSANVDFYINGTKVASSTTHLPNASTNLGTCSECTNTTAGTARTWRWGRLTGTRN